MKQRPDVTSTESVPRLSVFKEPVDVRVGHLHTLWAVPSNRKYRSRKPRRGVQPGVQDSRHRETGTNHREIRLSAHGGVSDSTSLAASKAPEPLRHPTETPVGLRDKLDQSVGKLHPLSEWPKFPRPAQEIVRR